MSNQYFTNKPTAEHDMRLIEDKLRGFALKFWTDAGVFSKGGIDFGSKLLIETMDIPEEGTVLDIGCGYGPVGITVAKLSPKVRVTMIDINERAVELSRRNLAQNGVVNADVKVSDLYASVAGEKFDRVLSNPPIRAGKSVVHAVFEGAVEHLTPDGELWVVIQKKQGAPSAKKKLEELFADVEDVARDAGFRIFRCRRING